MHEVLIWGSSPSGPHGVISHGVVLTFADNPTDIDVFVGKHLVRIRFEFPVDVNGFRGEYTTEPGVPESSKAPATILIRYYNLPEGTPVSDGPLRFATVGSFGLWLAYEVSAVVGNRLVKKITYTLWDGVVGDQTDYANSRESERRRG